MADMWKMRFSSLNDEASNSWTLKEMGGMIPYERKNQNQNVDE